MSNNNNSFSNNLVLVGLAVLALFIVVRVLPTLFKLTFGLVKLAILAGIIYVIFNERARHIALGVFHQLMDRLRK